MSIVNQIFDQYARMSAAKQSTTKQALPPQEEKVDEKKANGPTPETPPPHLPTCEYDDEAANNTVFLIQHGKPFLTVIVDPEKPGKKSFFYPREWKKVESDSKAFVLTDEFGTHLIDYACASGHDWVLSASSALEILKAKKFAESMSKNSYCGAENFKRSVFMDVLKHWHLVKQIPHVEFVNEWHIMVPETWKTQEFREFTVVQDENGRFVFDYDRKSDIFCVPLK